MSCCEVAAHLSVGLKDPKIPSGEGINWYPRGWLLAGNVSGITDTVTALPSSCRAVNIHMMDVQLAMNIIGCTLL